MGVIHACIVDCARVQQIILSPVYLRYRTFRNKKALSAEMNGQCFRMLSQNEISLFFENFMKMSMDTTVSTFRIVANAAAGPSDPRDTCV